MSIRCLTLPGVLRDHYWEITVAGQSSAKGALTHYKEPTIVSNQVEVINERMFGELSLFPTKGSTAILKGMNFGITQSGTAVPGTSIKIILYPRGDLNNPIEVRSNPQVENVVIV